MVQLLTIAAAALVALAEAKQSSASRRFLFELDPGQSTETFFQHAEQHGKVQTRMPYRLFNGASITIDDSQSVDHVLKELSSLPGVKQYWPVQHNQGQKASTTAATNKKTKTKRDTEAKPISQDSTKKVPYSPYVMTQIDRMHAAGFTGKGLKIALISTGVDYKHPALGGCFGKNCLVIGGYDFVGDRYSSGEDPQPKADPLDIDGLGTTGASILAAQPNSHLKFSGVAPGVKLLAYKVFGPYLYTTSDVIVDAIYRAVDDGADIITFSGEFRDAFPFTGIIEAATRATSHGIPVLMGIDSQYTFKNLFKVDAATNTADVEATGKFETDTIPALLANGYSGLSGHNTDEFWYEKVFVDDYRFNKEGDYNLPVYAISSNSNVTDDACKPLPDSTPANLNDYAILVRLGGCTINQKANNIKRNGIVEDTRILFYRDSPKDVYFGRPGYDDSTLSRFAGVVSAAVGERWVKQLSAGKNVTVHLPTLKHANYSLANGPNQPNGGAVVDGPWGPTQSLDIKPLFGAPAAMNVYAQLNKGYTVDEYYGKLTAMVAGAYALIAEARHIKPNPHNIQGLLASTSKAQLVFDGQKFVPGVFASVAQQGAGIMQVFDAANVKSTTEPIKLTFNDTEHRLKNAKVVVHNRGSASVTYNLHHVPAKTVYLLDSDSVSTDATATIDINPRKLVIEPGKSASFTVVTHSEKLPNQDKLPVWSGFIAINGTDGSDLTVPYLGVEGSLSSVLPLQGSGDDGKSVAMYYKGHRYSGSPPLQRPDPNGYSADVSIRFTLGSPKVEVYFVSLDSQDKPDGKLDGQMSYSPLLQQTGQIDATISFWDGLLNDGTKVPDGRYHVRVRALRLFGDEKKDSDWQTLTSVAFNLVNTD